MWTSLFLLGSWISYKIFKKRRGWVGVAGEDGGEIFQDGGEGGEGGGGLVQFLQKNKLKSEIFNKNKSLLTKMFSSVNLNSEFSYF